ncbi:hypothetical protein RDI58_018160 [Solanum bulbocastanum]|uniref:3-hydroxyisobutyryl-CoA hydrolase n=1 Tax=Solanum bulbocastanum TaxID=147425 RepID=A0AAN8Y9H7_SOLBU
MAEEIGRARMLTLNRPNHLNYLSGKVALTLGHNFEKYENDDNADFVIIKGTGRTFSAGGDLHMFYEERNTTHSYLQETTYCSCPWNVCGWGCILDGSSEILCGH